MAPEDTTTPKKYVIAIDQGTTSSRTIVFDHSGSIVSVGQLEHEQIFPKAGWVEHDPMEIWNNTREVIGQALSKADIIRAGHVLGVDFSMTVSCYQADAQGRACGACDSCRIRRAGFEAAGLPDATRYV